jgi:hypothetical protein
VGSFVRKVRDGIKRAEVILYALTAVNEDPLTGRPKSQVPYGDGG